jgi:FMN-dependent NADH-azoreductase
MTKLLYIDATIRGSMSRTKKASDYLVGQLTSCPGVLPETLRLIEEPLLNLTGDFFWQREALIEEKKFDHPRFRYAHQFAAADVIVIAAPFWDLGFPGLLKTYIENISVDGITFYSDAEGCHGMSKGHHLIFVTTRGGFYEGTHLEMGSRYMEALTEFFGIGRYTCLFAEGLDAEGENPEALMQKLLEDIDRFVEEKID